MSTGESSLTDRERVALREHVERTTAVSMRLSFRLPVVFVFELLLPEGRRVPMSVESELPVTTQADSELLDGCLSWTPAPVHAAEGWFRLPRFSLPQDIVCGLHNRPQAERLELRFRHPVPVSREPPQELLPSVQPRKATVPFGAMGRGRTLRP